MREAVYLNIPRARIAAVVSVFDGWPVSTMRVTSAYIRPSQLCHVWLGLAALGAVLCLSLLGLGILPTPLHILGLGAGALLMPLGVIAFTRSRELNCHLVVKRSQGEIKLIQFATHSELLPIIDALREAASDGQPRSAARLTDPAGSGVPPPLPVVPRPNWQASKGSA